MDFGRAIRRGFEHFADFEGRARRSEYWLWHLFSNGLIGAALFIAIVIGAYYAGLAAGQGAPPPDAGQASRMLLAGFAISRLIVFLPNLSMTIRRLHDSGRTGWWYLIRFVPFGDIVLLVLLLLDSEEETNRFGPNPRSGQPDWIVTPA